MRHPVVVRLKSFKLPTPQLSWKHCLKLWLCKIEWLFGFPGRVIFGRSAGLIRVMPVYLIGRAGGRGGVGCPECCLSYSRTGRVWGVKVICLIRAPGLLFIMLKNRRVGWVAWLILLFILLKNSWRAWLLFNYLNHQPERGWGVGLIDQVEGVVAV